MSLLTSSNTDYHANRSHLSSSNLKMLLKDPAQFKREWIDGIREPQVDKPAFMEGTLTHSLILEPETILDYAVYPGLRKAGNAWEEFKLANPDKKLVSITQMQRAERMFKSYSGMSTAVNLVKNGVAEHTMLGKIYDVSLKARADYIVPKQYIVDVKTTAMPSDADIFRQTVEDYGYHTSAALYCELAKQTYGVEHDFYWLVLSKEDNGCHVYKAGDSLIQGRLLVEKAVALYKQCLRTGVWQLEQPKQSFDSETYEIVEI